jgi:hypothetical protein
MAEVGVAGSMAAGALTHKFVSLKETKSATLQDTGEEKNALFDPDLGRLHETDPLMPGSVVHGRSRRRGINGGRSLDGLHGRD